MWIQICLLFVKQMCGLISPDKKSLQKISRRWCGWPAGWAWAPCQSCFSGQQGGEEYVTKNKVQYDFQKIAKLSSPKQKKILM